MSDTPALPVIASVSGDSPMGEVAKAGVSRFAGQRVMGLWRWLPLATFFGVGAVFGVAAEVIGAYRGSTDVLAAGGAVAIVVLLMAVTAANRVFRRQSVRRWMQRGLSPVNMLTFTIDDEAFTVAGTVSTTRLKWTGVSELAPLGRGVTGKGYWIIPAAGLVYFIPRRFFPTPQDEGAFLAAMLARMPPEARARSVEARKLTAFE